jgi:hypothetical protein
MRLATGMEKGLSDWGVSDSLRMVEDGRLV